MKICLALVGLIVLSACATGNEDCSKITDPNFRDACFADQIEDDLRDQSRPEESE